MLYLRHLKAKLNWKIKNWKIQIDFYWFVLEEISKVTSTRYKAKKEAYCDVQIKNYWVVESKNLV